MDTDLKNIVFSRDVVEFVTVSVQYCNFLENAGNIMMADFTDKLTKILPLLYLKATMLPENEMFVEETPETVVTEEHYNHILSHLYELFGKDDAYLEVFMEDMKYSDTPVSASISENLADIYQDIKNFISVYERGIEENMNDALFVCNENFKTFWGQSLVNVLRALHTLKYSDNINIEEENTEYLW